MVLLLIDAKKKNEEKNTCDDGATIKAANINHRTREKKIKTELHFRRQKNIWKSYEKIWIWNEIELFLFIDFSQIETFWHDTVCVCISVPIPFEVLVSSVFTISVSSCLFASFLCVKVFYLFFCLLHLFCYSLVPKPCTVYTLSGDWLEIQKK